VDLADSQASFVMGAANVQRFTSALMSSQDGTSWNVAVRRANPVEPSSTQKVEVGLEYFQTCPSVKIYVFSNKFVNL
jgi:hypothetical protein